MKRFTFLPALLAVFALASTPSFAEPPSESAPPPASETAPTQPTNSVSTEASATAEANQNLPVGPFDTMDLETLRQKVAELQQQLKQKLQDSDTDVAGEEITQLRDQAILANAILKKKEAEFRIAEREKWLGHLEEVTAKLTSMRQERHGILNKLYQETKKEYEASKASFDKVLAAEQDLADAELDLLGREAYKPRIQRLFQWQETLEASVRTNENLERDYLKLKARYLKTYIEYLKGSEESYKHILEGYQE